MKIIKLEIENVKKIKAMSITPDANVNKVGGSNGEGKTSLLDSMMYAIGGRSFVDGKPVRNGEDTATVQIEFEDYIVKKVIKSNNNEYLKVMLKDGKEIKSPQKFLDDICGAKGIAFDPTTFASKKVKDQIEILKKISGVSFSQIETDRKIAFDKRKYVNRRVDEIKALISNLDIDEEEMEVFLTSDEIKEQYKLRDEIAEAELKVDSIEDKMDKHKSRMNWLRDEISKMKSLIERYTKEGVSLKEKVSAIEGTLDARKEDIRVMKKKLVDDDVLGEAMDAMGSNNSAKAKKVELDRLNKELIEVETKARDYTQEIKGLDNEKFEMLKNAKLPIKGLAFNDLDVTYKGIPISQVSHAEKIKIGMAISFANDSKLKIALIRDGSLLDDTSMKTVEKMAKKYDGQVWIEVVTSKQDDCDLLIEDGEIV